MNEKTILHVNNLGKRFKLYPSPWYRVMEWFSPLRRKFHKPFWANREISFDVKQGEFFGIIGVNGAGKSTLLKMLSGVLDPTEGDFQLEGRVLSLLELGGNLKKELTGRENVWRSAQLLNLPDDYVEQQLEKVLAFSELGEFFDRPVMTYSSGMSTRLSFSLFAFIECDVLILDEALAVGDVFFRQKCYQRLDELIQSGTSIILVTHSMGVVKKYCQRVMVLHNGHKVFLGEPEEAIRVYSQMRSTIKRPELQAEVLKRILEEPSNDTFDAYLTEQPAVDTNSFWPDEASLIPVPDTVKGNRAELVKFAVCDENGKPCLAFKQHATTTLYYEVKLKRKLPIPFAQVSIRDKFGKLIHAKNTLQTGAPHPSVIEKGGRVRFRQRIKLDLATGQYLLDLAIFALPMEKNQHFPMLSTDEFNAHRLLLAKYERLINLMVFPAVDEIASGTFNGICDLPGNATIEVVRKDEEYQR